MGKIVRREFVGIPHVFYLSNLFGIPLFAMLMLLMASAHADDKTKLAAIPTGSANQEVDVGEKRLKLFTYKPKDYKKGPLLLVFHGAGRNAADNRDAAILLASGPARRPRGHAVVRCRALPRPTVYAGRPADHGW